MSTILEFLGTVPKVPVVKCENHLSHNLIRDRISQQQQQDANIHHQFSSLRNHYPEQASNHYDLISMEFLSTAKQLARKVPRLHSGAASILDLGCGTGGTALELAKLWAPDTAIERLYFVDGIPDMLSQTSTKLDIARESGAIPSVDRNLVSTLLADVQDVTMIRSELIGHALPNIILAQRVLITVLKSQRATLLQAWMSLDRPGTRLVVDVPHPHRHLGALVLGKGQTSGLRALVGEEATWAITDTQTWSECRAYANELAEEAGLVIDGTMNPQIDTEDSYADAQDRLEDWIKASAPPNLVTTLDLGEKECFRRMFARSAVEHYRTYGVRCNIEIAAVQVIFSRPVTLQTTTRYDIDSTLTGKARKQAIKNAAKMAKKGDRARSSTEEKQYCRDDD